ncbi:MAG: hypothetical protein K2K25_11065 [Muribaculaceae bacterium]|nr:hypothetical protein [Muribaculaceae bacterium]
MSYTISTSNETFERETKALVKIGERLPVQRRIIITYDEESIIEKDNHSIEVMPAWKFLLT